jgi:hypothetical protein
MMAIELSVEVACECSHTETGGDEVVADFRQVSSHVFYTSVAERKFILCFSSRGELGINATDHIRLPHLLVPSNRCHHNSG